MDLQRGTRYRRPGGTPRAGLIALAFFVIFAPHLGLSGSAATRPPTLAYQHTVLPNGLSLIVLEDHSTPIVNVQVWYHVGSKDERRGRTGFAHLFEHLMFKGSKNVKPDQHTTLLTAAGGLTNAYTTEDVTVYWNTVPSSHLPLALWLEADRMATLRIDRETFEREREVVKEERRMRIENQPYGRLAEIIYDQAFQVHPYKHQTIGAMKDLDAAKVEDVREFFRTYYVPNNATLVVAGDVDTKQVIDLTTRYFGRIPKRGRPIPRDMPAEPPVTAARRVELRESWPLPVVVVAHHVTFDGHPDSYPLQLASKILSDGESSRIYRALVYEQGMALAAYGGGHFVEHPNLFFAVAIVQPGFTPVQAEVALAAELDRLRTGPVTDRELMRAKNQLARDYILGRTTVEQKAQALGHAAVIHKDPASADAELALFQAVTAADIQRVARQYFAPEGRLTIRVVPEGRTGERR
ncbi:MAG: pitrilysin family protein [Vicinamibacterales bacterium]|nr:pitrilysin family protein [Vicinamibacterales bacterium]